MPIPSNILNVGRIRYTGSTDIHAEVPVIPSTAHPCLDLLTDYLHDTFAGCTPVPPSMPLSIWQQYDHSDHTSDNEVITCVADMFRNLEPKRNTNHRIDEKRFYQTRLGQRDIAGADIRSTMSEKTSHMSNIVAR